ncbi:MAG TPA: hypothetical protein VF754_01000 [Pyrinomonadaceae bacterium]
MAQTGTQTSVEQRLTTMRILCIVFLANIGLFALVGYITGQSAGAERDASDGFSNLLLAFFALGVAAVAASFAVRSVFQAKAEREQSQTVVQQGLIMALVMCEVAALLGLVGLFIDGHPYTYLLFVVAAVGDLLHFPRREHLLVASYKTADRNAAV